MKIQHAYREGNAVADRLAFEAHSHTGTIFYWSEFALPESCSQASLFDRLGLFSYRPS